MIEYTSENGYTGQIYGKGTMIIVDRYGKELFHTAHRNIQTFDELKEEVDGFPEFQKKITEFLKNESLHPIAP